MSAENAGGMSSRTVFGAAGSSLRTLAIKETTDWASNGRWPVRHS